MINDLFEAVPKFTEFTYWFIRIGKRRWAVGKADEQFHESNIILVEREYSEVVQGLQKDMDEDSIIAEFQKFKKRPEYFVGKPFYNMVGDAAAVYEYALIGAAFIRAKRKGCADPDMAYPAICKCLIWLRSTNFYTSPASTRYHESFTGGLLLHSLKVADNMCDLKQMDIFQSVPYEDAILVALIHDWCKIGMYKKFNKNVKNEDTGVWESVEAFKRDKPLLPMGHGAASQYLASRFFKLSLEEALAIRWHMSAWRAVPDEYDELQQANEEYPIVHMLQFADQLSITKYFNPSEK